MITCDWLSEDTERTSSTWLMVLTASSIFLLISVSTSSGDAPGLITVTSTVGISTFGNRSTPKLKYEKIPTTTNARISMVANTGRRTHN